MTIEFAIGGDNIANNASVGTVSNGGNDNAGQARISGGQRLFESDDIVVVTAQGETSDGQLTGSGGIIGIVVYDNLADYETRTPKYVYEPQNPGQVATIQGDVSGLGDLYLRFNGSVLVSRDPSAPRLQNVLVTPEASIANGESYTTDRDVDLDYDGDGVIDPGPFETGDSAFNAGAYSEFATPICFAAETLIDTPGGQCRADALRVGDLVLTRDGGAQPIRWIGRRSYDASQLDADPSTRPVRVAAGALGEGRPARDLVLSGQHRILVRSRIAMRMFAAPEVLVAVKQLLDVEGIEMADDLRSVTYVHFMFDRHEIVMANGAEAESLYAGPEALRAIDEGGRAEMLSIFPALSQGGALPHPVRILVKGSAGRQLAFRHRRNGIALLDDRQG